MKGKKKPSLPKQVDELRRRVEILEAKAAKKPSFSTEGTRQILEQQRLMRGPSTRIGCCARANIPDRVGLLLTQ